MAPQHRVVVLGSVFIVDSELYSELTTPRAGVSGLTAAFILSKTKNYTITVAAKHMPGDYDIEYASPWAGANYLPYVQTLG